MTRRTALAALAGGWLPACSPPGPPPPPAVLLTIPEYAALIRRFNAEQNKARLFALFSPT